ncbi:probable G-protein coupled receptor 83 [Limulus polyphemus]|uniref:Probable G-protein coupled receptor 83 n=1 Tax=Limulus polyphemus TaxID=6850 RepID=A0ABM1BEB3_LIMPO|nr:probable G-protein coupled receptor 83 [Limulus polyphemus]
MELINQSSNSVNVASDDYEQYYDIFFDEVFRNLMEHTVAENETDVLKLLLRNWSETFIELFDQHYDYTKEVLVIFFYTLIIIISVFGNGLICYTVLQRGGRRTKINILIVNLSISDLLMTVLNIPFNVARLLLPNWPFGQVMCGLLPFVQVTTVYVSSFTMVCIAIDRYRAIVHPLMPRKRTGNTRIISVIWILAALLAIGHAVFNKVLKVFSYRLMMRCRVVYPSPAEEYRKWHTFITTLTQYVIPLAMTTVAYGRVVVRIWRRETIGDVTEQQLASQLQAKRRTIKMLILVGIVFAICWLPLNLYHLIIDFNLSPEFLPSTTYFFMFHWLAMSSVCYNPFIYCWLNKHFRTSARKVFRYCFCYKDISSSNTAEQFNQQNRTTPLDNVLNGHCKEYSRHKTDLGGSQSVKTCVTISHLQGPGRGKNSHKDSHDSSSPRVLFSLKRSRSLLEQANRDKNYLTVDDLHQHEVTFQWEVTNVKTTTLRHSFSANKILARIRKSQSWSYV